MKDPDRKRFLAAKEATLQNLETLLAQVAELENLGFNDVENRFYNQIYRTIEGTDATENDYQLSAMISQAQNIEKDVDVHYAYYGRNTNSLKWPQANL